MQEIIKQILEAPHAYLILERAQAILNDEKEKRLNFYDEVDESQKVEFINGEIVVHSPVRLKHNQINGLLHQMINIYVAQNQLGFVGIEKILIALTRNDYEPDLCFFGNEKANSFTDEQTIFPAPDFIVEILSPATAERDRGIKFSDYAAHGVAEYWIIDPKEETIEQYFLEEQRYQLHIKVKEGTIRSQVISDFEIPIRAVFSPAENFKALQQLMN